MSQPKKRSGIACGIYVVAAALRVAAVTGATVVEMVGGPAGRIKQTGDGGEGSTRFVDFRAVLEAEEREQETLRRLLLENPREDEGDGSSPIAARLAAEAEEEKERQKDDWLPNAPEPARILAWNLFVLARFILTKLPPTDDSYRPPVSLALEIEPGTVYWLNSIRRFDEVLACYRELTRRYVDALDTPEDFRAFRQFESLQTVDEACRRQLTVLFERCVGLNVDIGHMMLTGTHPCEVAPLCELGVAGCTTPGECPFDLDAGGTGKCCWLRYPETVRNERMKSILHYHLSDHHLVHYCDLPPGERHAKTEFFPWLRQAFALKQLPPRTYLREDDQTGMDSSEPQRHPNFTGCVALELEASPGGKDQVVTAYALVRQWIQEVMQDTILGSG